MVLRAAIAVYRVHWGLSSRAWFGSASQPSYLLPPPTTILGALAKTLHDLGLLGTREFIITSIGSGSILTSGAASIIKILGRRWWVSAAWLSPSIRTGILIRYFTGPYQSLKTRREDLPQKLAVHELFAPIKLGYTISPHGRVMVLVASEDGDIDALKTGLQHVSRLGGKESFVDPLAVFEAQLVEEHGVNEIVTPWLTLRECVGNVYGNYVAEKTPVPRDADELICSYSAEPCSKLNPSLTRFNVLREAIHPRYPGWVRVKINTDKCGVYRVESLNSVFPSKREPTIEYILVHTRIVIPRVRDHGKEAG
ncbi:CRISPR-associated protein Cas5 [Pyrolobus fumarii 1A]|uniref:CRISPR-associated protein Cas5 n=1 Tax=Pyrolobus fumarii (strain DSM 11204 / 1A) TaxID=694429 RepID=G0EGK5_PYRF1|nr:CRISPR-associated protein Cas5 [Pyrolobus fumarii]AEM38379.1 CRISPR-associated protein Cas5 [Pyrolobus fumarii 1A]